MVIDVKSFINTLQHIKNKNSKLICTMCGSKFAIIDIIRHGNFTFIKTSYTSTYSLNVRQLVSKLINLNADNNFILLRIDGEIEVINTIQEDKGYTIIKAELINSAIGN